MKGQYYPAQHAHQHHGEADGVEHVHAQEVAEGGPAPGDEIFLQTKQEPEGKDFGATADGGARDLRGRKIFFTQLAGDQSE